MVAPILAPTRGGRGPRRSNPDTAVMISDLVQISAKARLLRSICVNLDKALTTDTAAAPDKQRDLSPPSSGWCVVDSFCNAGYRYLITRSLDCKTPDRRALSQRERDVARMAARGDALKVIADTCSISLQAVSTYLKRAKRKLGVAS